MNTIYTVALKDGTVGTISSDSINGQHAREFIGEIVRLDLRDENGGQIFVEGTLAEILEEERK